jgi:hypothetical protein
MLASVALDRLPPQVRPVELQQVEGVQERLRLVPPVPEGVECRHARSSQHTTFAVDQVRPHLQAVHRLDHEGKASGPVINRRMPTGSRRAMSLPVVLDLVEPTFVCRRTIFFQCDGQPKGVSVARYYFHIKDGAKRTWRAQNTLAHRPLAFTL